MPSERIFRSADFMQPAEHEPLRSVITETTQATVVAWLVLPGQRIAPHLHPQGQDTWTVLSGTGDYQLDVAGNARRIGAGDVTVASAGDVHGVVQIGTEPLRFISVVCPAEAGYEPV